MINISVFCETQDEWYGNYKIRGDARVSDLVQVSYLPLSDGTYRCCVWGNDDMGLEFDHANQEYVWEIFVQVISQQYVNQAPLRALGFVPA